MLAGWLGLGYGVYLTVLALGSVPGTELTGHWALQPAFKASMALSLALAAAGHTDVRERRWLMPALLFSAVGDWALALPWWAPSFVVGLGAFLSAHVCYVGALLPLRARPSAPRLVAVVAMGVVAVAQLAWFWPRLGPQRLALPVTLYILVLTAMVCAALLARLPTRWAAVGAVCFAASDSMIAIGRFVLGNEALAVPVWWSYAAAQILITAGFFFGRARPGAEAPDASADG